MKVEIEKECPRCSGSQQSLKTGLVTCTRQRLLISIEDSNEKSVSHSILSTGSQTRQEAARDHQAIAVCKTTNGVPKDVEAA